MKNIVLISGHPDISRSTANRIIIENLISEKGITACDINLNYPDYNFDIANEQELLASADFIILQTPFIWYGLPAHVKLWIEKVFTHGFAHGSTGDKLKGKQFLLSLTIGGSRESYNHKGDHQYPIEYFLKPIELFVKYCGLHYLPPVYSFGMASTAYSNFKEIETKALLQASTIKDFILQFTNPNQLKPLNFPFATRLAS